MPKGRGTLARRPGDEGMGSALAPPTPEGGLVAVGFREESQMKALVGMAKLYPRDEDAARARIMKACERPVFAEKALYRFPRGKSMVEGLSVDFAREAARCWGNMMVSHRIVSEDDERVHIRGLVFDAETGLLTEHEDKFRKLIYRKADGWKKPDERELRELVNRRGAICERNAILKALPADLKEEAHEAANRTHKGKAKRDVTENKPASVDKLLASFSEIEVTKKMLENKLQHGIADIDDKELAELRKVAKSIRDGNTVVADHFGKPAVGGETEEGTLGVEDLSPGSE